jgi:16S rRNA A1518/A1519 N6-dimethyltransferase RsmA/KsgA/DIM1 with predicted DNA glycosylase/AP lyase activity
VVLKYQGRTGLAKGSEDFFFKLSKMCFSKRRKQLKNVFLPGLKVLKFSERDILSAAEDAQINLTDRAEDIPVRQWVAFSNSLRGHP